MAANQVKAFFEYVKNSEDVQRQMQAIQETGESDLLNIYVQLAQVNGFEVTAEELETEIEGMAMNMVGEGELSDEELESVAGGGCPYCMFTKGSYCFFTK
ncbi:Nif11-like leader peptide family RiPP precursor [Anoxynatronum buryatiense]|uniref:Nif11-like leader peptide domain-containing protein n=1 Tax=Anoxynatronum buryatiense TaxID=489973 RepID=A0AA45WVU6_9CLOT|nr:Nif11-like leader peptide family RiPP precursor [Anoxynatronum buryatiense]SMP54804.1 nif11-like leader peptide domain-containing protein [Anoxynatronum buryatiense]